MNKSELSAERKQSVVKSNDIVQQSKYKLSTQQQKLILYMISKIRPHDTDFKEYTFDLKNLCQILNIDISGGNYIRFRDNIQKIADCSFWIRIDGKDKLYRWLDDVEIEPHTTTVKVKFDEDLKPFLLELKDNYTIFQLEKVLCFDSKYSFRLYELFKSTEYKEKIVLSVEELKEKLMIADKYDRFTTFKEKVLNKAISEINTYTYINIKYNLIRTNRTITHIEFIIVGGIRIDWQNKKNRQLKLNFGD